MTVLEAALSSDTLRYVNVGLSSSAVILVIVISILRMDQITTVEKILIPPSVGVLAVIAYGSGETAHQDIEFGIRLILLMVALLSLVVALVISIYIMHTTDDTH